MKQKSWSLNFTVNLMRLRDSWEILLGFSEFLEVFLRKEDLSWVAPSQGLKEERKLRSSLCLSLLLDCGHSVTRHSVPPSPCIPCHVGLYPLWLWGTVNLSSLKLLLTGICHSNRHSQSNLTQEYQWTASKKMTRTRGSWAGKEFTGQLACDKNDKNICYFLIIKRSLLIVHFSNRTQLLKCSVTFLV